MAILKVERAWIFFSCVLRGAHAINYYVAFHLSLIDVHLVLVSDPKPTPAQNAFSILHALLEAIYAPDEVWGQD